MGRSIGFEYHGFSPEEISFTDLTYIYSSSPKIRYLAHGAEEKYRKMAFTDSLGARVFYAEYIEESDSMQQGIIFNFKEIMHSKSCYKTYFNRSEAREVYKNAKYVKEYLKCYAWIGDECADLMIRPTFKDYTITVDEGAFRGTESQKLLITADRKFFINIHNIYIIKEIMKYYSHGFMIDYETLKNIVFIDYVPTDRLDLIRKLNITKTEAEKILIDFDKRCVLNRNIKVPVPILLNEEDEESEPSTEEVINEKESSHSKLMELITSYQSQDEVSCEDENPDLLDVETELLGFTEDFSD